MSRKRSVWYLSMFAILPILRRWPPVGPHLLSVSLPLTFRCCLTGRRGPSLLWGEHGERLCRSSSSHRSLGVLPRKMPMWLSGSLYALTLLVVVSGEAFCAWKDSRCFSTVLYPETSCCAERLPRDSHDRNRNDSVARTSRLATCKTDRWLDRCFDHGSRSSLSSASRLSDG
jgi:hypothetical protein